MGLDHALTVIVPVKPKSSTEPTIRFDWRKENHIHKWWVERYPDGDNSSVVVSGTHLLEFYVTCRDVIHSLDKGGLSYRTVPNGYSFENGVKTEYTREAVTYENTEIAEKLMPPQSGFFFGSTEIDEFYYQSLNDVVQRFKPFIAELEDNPDLFEGHYWSWW